MSESLVDGAVAAVGIDLKVYSFLLREGQLLDRGELDLWLSLFTHDSHYWIPAKPEQLDAVSHISLVYDDRRHLEERVHRLQSGVTQTRKPPTRTVHIISAPLVERRNTEIHAWCSFAVHLARGVDVSYTLAGISEYVLREEISTGEYLIESKRIDLLNGSQPINDLSFII